MVTETLDPSKDIFVSYTAWRRFEECQLKELLLRAKVPRAHRDIRPFIVGNSVHHAFEYWVKECGCSGTPEVERALSYFDNRADKVLWQGVGDRNFMRARVADCFNLLSPLIVRVVADADWVLAEEEGKVEVDGFPGAWMTAKTDLLVGLPGDRVVVFDYKTSVSSSDARQLWWACHVWRNAIVDYVPKVEGCFLQADYSLLEAKVVRVMPSEEEMAQAVDAAKRIVHCLRYGPIVSSPKHWTCSQCDVRVSCSDSVWRPMNTSRG